MKKPPAPGALRRVAIVLGILTVSLALLSAPWRVERAAGEPRIEAVVRCPGDLRAGAAFVPFELPAGAPIGGFPRWDYRSTGLEEGVGARALSFSAGVAGGEGACRVVVVAADLVLVPDALVEAVRARLGEAAPAGLVVVATHTHAGPGGYWDHALGERFGTGPYDPRLAGGIAEAIARAAREAAAAEVPAHVAHGAARLPEYARNRAGGEAVDGHLDVVRVSASGTGAGGAGRTIGELVVYPAHPTLLGKRNTVISGDWPGALAARASEGVRLVLQGAGGDQSARLPGEGPLTAATYAAALAGRLEDPALAGAPLGPATHGGPDPDGGPALALATVTLPLPHAAPGAAPALLRRAAGTLLDPLVPETLRVSALDVAGLRLVTVPGEPVAAVGQALRDAAGPRAIVVGLAGGYCGYVEMPDLFRTGAGEARRSYYGPELAPRVVAAAGAAARAVEWPATASGSR